MTRWREVWGARRAPHQPGSPLVTLLALDGFDTAFAEVTEQDWLGYVHSVGARLRVTPGDSVYEVGCGAGAFLYPLWSAGVTVGGLDYSAGLIDAARSAMPTGRFDVRDADELAVEYPVDIVVSSSAFLYFDSLAYAGRVIDAMARAAGAVALLDLPDAALADRARCARVRAFGDAQAYEERYRDLPHLAFDRGWVMDRLQAAGLHDVEVEDQSLRGYDNSPYRFNAFAVSA